MTDDVWHATTDDKINELLGAESTALFLLGAFADDHSLIGVVGLRRELRPTTRHKASLWGLTVLPRKRRQGVGTQLVAALREEAKHMPGLEMLRLVILSQNASAIALLHKQGFQTYAVEPRARRMDDAYYDQALLYCRMGADKEDMA